MMIRLLIWALMNPLSTTYMLHSHRQNFKPILKGFAEPLEQKLQMTIPPTNRSSSVNLSFPSLQSHPTLPPNAQYHVDHPIDEALTPNTKIEIPPKIGNPNYLDDLETTAKLRSLTKRYHRRSVILQDALQRKHIDVLNLRRLLKENKSPAPISSDPTPHALQIERDARKEIQNRADFLSSRVSKLEKKNRDLMAENADFLTDLRKFRQRLKQQEESGRQSIKVQKSKYKLKIRDLEGKLAEAEAANEATEDEEAEPSGAPNEIDDQLIIAEAAVSASRRQEELLSSQLKITSEKVTTALADLESERVKSAEHSVRAKKMFGELKYLRLANDAAANESKEWEEAQKNLEEQREKDEAEIGCLRQQLEDLELVLESEMVTEMESEKESENEMEVEQLNPPSSSKLRRFMRRMPLLGKRF